jgi:hypothetical protein
MNISPATFAAVSSVMSHMDMDNFSRTFGPVRVMSELRAAGVSASMGEVHAACMRIWESPAAMDDGDIEDLQICAEDAREEFPMRESC